MFIPKDVRCIICLKLFCCSSCRKRHQEETHTDKLDLVKISCDICNGKPFQLKNTNSTKVIIEHVIKNHLPLKCDKCFKIFDHQSSFNDIEKCFKKDLHFQENMDKLLESIPEIDINSTNTKETKNNGELTPDVNGKENNNSRAIQKSSLLDSVLSIQNVSSINKSSQLVINTTKSPNKNVVRSTSTPMQKLMTDMKTTNRYHGTFNSSSGSNMMISSITHTTPSSLCSGSDSDISPPNVETSSFTMKKPIASRGRIKLRGAATPLRQVMSKSIQRAIQEHGIRNFNDIRQYSETFDSVTGNTLPLDLRTTPVLRRADDKISTSKNIEQTKENVLIDAPQSQHSNENLLRQSTNHINPLIPTPIAYLTNNNSNDSQSIYKTCEFFEYRNEESNYSKNSLMTPKITTNYVANIKKTISFTSPIDSPLLQTTTNNESNNDVWFTPNSFPVRSYSCSVLEIRKNEITTTKHDTLDDVFYRDNTKKEENYAIENNTQASSSLVNIPASEKLWSFVTKTVMKIASFGGSSQTSNNVDNCETTENTGSLRRFATFSGFGTSTSSNHPDKNQYECSSYSNQPSIKRRKTSHSSYGGSKNFFAMFTGNSDKKTHENLRRKKIKGRQPIGRMRVD